MPKLTVGERVEYVDADHPQRADSAEYRATRRELMTRYGGGCFI